MATSKSFFKRRSLSWKAIGIIFVMTVFAWAQSLPAEVELVLFDVRGRRVSQPLSRTHYPAGDHLLPWSPSSKDGARLAAGVYYLRLIIDGQPRDTRRIVLVR